MPSEDTSHTSNLSSSFSLLTHATSLPLQWFFIFSLADHLHGLLPCCSLTACALHECLCSCTPAIPFQLIPCQQILCMAPGLLLPTDYFPWTCFSISPSASSHLVLLFFPCSLQLTLCIFLQCHLWPYFLFTHFWFFPTPFWAMMLCFDVL